MKFCDNCGQPDGKHTEIGEVRVSVGGYHWHHHTHWDGPNRKPESWQLELCPHCAGILKDRIGEVIESLKAVEPEPIQRPKSSESIQRKPWWAILRQ